MSLLPKPKRWLQVTSVNPLNENSDKDQGLGLTIHGLSPETETSTKTRNWKLTHILKEYGEVTCDKPLCEYERKSGKGQDNLD